MPSDAAGPGVLITGASTGIGFETAKRLVSSGARVFFTGLPPEEDVNSAAAEIISDRSKIACTTMDSLDPESITRAVALAGDFLGDIDVLVNNAGVASQARVIDHDLARAEVEMQINYFGMFRVTQAVLPAMLERRRGTIVNVASTLARVPGPTQANYSATKAAIAAFSAALRSEVEDFGIHVTTFVPGLTATHLTEGLAVRSPKLLSASEAGEHLVKAIRAHPAEYTTGTMYRALGVMGRLMPEASRRMLKRYY